MQGESGLQLAIQERLGVLCATDLHIFPAVRPRGPLTAIRFHTDGLVGGLFLRAQSLVLPPKQHAQRHVSRDDRHGTESPTWTKMPPDEPAGQLDGDPLLGKLAGRDALANQSEPEQSLSAP